MCHAVCLVNSCICHKGQGNTSCNLLLSAHGKWIPSPDINFKDVIDIIFDVKLVQANGFYVKRAKAHVLYVKIMYFCTF